MVCCGSGVPLWVGPMTATPKPYPRGERLRKPKRPMMNSRLPKRMVSPREKLLHDKRSPSTMTASTDDGTIGTI
jgi:hypothetical protein